MARLDHAEGILAAVRTASRDRLLRFMAACDPEHRWWHAEQRVTAADIPVECLRDAAAVFAMQFRTRRHTARYWRDYYARHGLPPLQPLSRFALAAE